MPVSPSSLFVCLSPLFSFPCHSSTLCPHVSHPSPALSPCLFLSLSFIVSLSFCLLYISLSVSFCLFVPKSSSQCISLNFLTLVISQCSVNKCSLSAPWCLWVELHLQEDAHTNLDSHCRAVWASPGFTFSNLTYSQSIKKSCCLCVLVGVSLYLY